MHIINGAKGGKKRAENYRKKQQEDVEEDKCNNEGENNISETFLNATRSQQIGLIQMLKDKGIDKHKIKAYENAMKPY